MSEPAAECEMRTKRFGPKLRFRVDNQGVAVFGPKHEHLLIRFDWLQSIAAETDGVHVRSLYDEIVIPRGAFDLDPATLARQLEAARSFDTRSDIISRLAVGAPHYNG